MDLLRGLFHDFPKNCYIVNSALNSSCFGDMFRQKTVEAKTCNFLKIVVFTRKNNGFWCSRPAPKKTRLIFWANFVAQEITQRFPKNIVFWSKTRCKAAAAPQIDKKHSWRCSPRLPFWPQVDLLSILGSLEGTPKPAFGTKCRLKVAKKWNKHFIQGSPRVPRMWFSFQSYILGRFYIPTGGPNASSGRILAPEKSKSGGSLR